MGPSWAVDLIKGIHSKFTHGNYITLLAQHSLISQLQGLDRNRPRMYWKMSIDLNRPMVTSEGNLDPYDGLITYRIINASASGSPLSKEISDMERMVKEKFRSFTTDDPLDLGKL